MVQFSEIHDQNKNFLQHSSTVDFGLTRNNAAWHGGTVCWCNDPCFFRWAEPYPPPCSAPSPIVQTFISFASPLRRTIMNYPRAVVHWIDDNCLPNLARNSKRTCSTRWRCKWRTEKRHNLIRASHKVRKHFVGSDSIIYHLKNRTMYRLHCTYFDMYFNFNCYHYIYSD